MENPEEKEKDETENIEIKNDSDSKQSEKDPFEEFLESTKEETEEDNSKEEISETKKEEKQEETDPLDIEATETAGMIIDIVNVFQTKYFRLQYKKNNLDFKDSDVSFSAPEKKALIKPSSKIIRKYMGNTQSPEAALAIALFVIFGMRKIELDQKKGEVKDLTSTREIVEQIRKEESNSTEPKKRGRGRPKKVQ